MKSLPDAPRPGRWETLPPLETPRSHPAVTVHDGKIYVIGGGGPNFQSLDSVEIYDPSEGIWRLGIPMPTRRSGAAAITIHGKILVIGGGYKKPDGKFVFLRTVEIFDPAAGAWKTGPDLLMPHDYPASVRLGDFIYILGGHHPDATEGGPQTDPGLDFCERLAVSQDRGPVGGWQEIAPLPAPRFAVSAATVEGWIWATGGVAFTGQGLTEYDAVDLYDPTAGVWTREPELSLPWPSAAHGIAILDKGVYLFGGFSTDWIHTRCAVYDPAEKSWSALPPHHKPRAAMGIAALDDAIYLIGGWERDGRTVMNDVTAYYPR